MTVGSQNRWAFVVERVGARGHQDHRERTGGAQSGGESQVIAEATGGEHGERAHGRAVVTQDAGHQRTVRGVERGVEQRDGALAQQLRQAFPDDRAGGADHDRAGEVHVVRGSADVTSDVHDARSFGRFQEHPDGAGRDLLVRVHASQALAHSGCVCRRHDQFARTDQALVWSLRIMRVHRAEGTNGVIDQLREAVDLLGRVHIGHHPPPRHGPQGTEAQCHSIR